MLRAALRGLVAKHASGNHPHSGPFADADRRPQAAAVETHRLHGTAVDFELLQFEVALEIDRLRLLEARLANSAERSKCSTTSFIPLTP